MVDRAQAAERHPRAATIQVSRRHSPARAIAPLDSLAPVAFAELPGKSDASSAAWRNALLDKLTKPGLCIAGLDARLRNALFGTIKVRSETTSQRFALRKAADGTLGVYRIADAAAAVRKQPSTKTEARK